MNDGEKAKQEEVRSGDTVATIASHGKLKFYPVYINNRKYTCLRDSGCTTIVANSRMVEDGKKDTLIMADGTKIECPTATLTINSPWFQGEVRARDLKDAICYLIIGNIEGVVDNSDEMFKTWCDNNYQVCAGVQTRATTKRKENIDIDVDEKIEIGSQLMSKQEFKKLQEEDKTVMEIKTKLIKDSQTGHNKHYTVDRGILVNSARAGTVKRVVIPEKLQETIIKMAHDSPLGGHMGAKKTIASITDNFYWPKLAK